jgi:hypothetical protein
MVTYIANWNPTEKTLSWPLTIHPSWCTGGCWCTVACICMFWDRGNLEPDLFLVPSNKTNGLWPCTSPMLTNWPDPILGVNLPCQERTFQGIIQICKTRPSAPILRKNLGQVFTCKLKAWGSRLCEGLYGNKDLTRRSWVWAHLP